MTGRPLARGLLQAAGAWCRQNTALNTAPQKAGPAAAAWSRMAAAMHSPAAQSGDQQQQQESPGPARTASPRWGPQSPPAGQPQQRSPQPQRLPKPALLELVHQLERRDQPPPLCFETREAADSTVREPKFEASVQLPPSLFDGRQGKKFCALARSKREAEHAAALAALTSLEASGVLAPRQAVEVAEMRQHAAVEAAAAEAAAAAQLEAQAPQAEAEKLPTHQQLEELQAALGYSFRNPQLLRQACIHPSAGEHNNDRLALLGDRVLDLVVLQQGMRHLPDANKFELSSFKVARVSRAACSLHARRIGLGPQLAMQPGFRQKDGTLGPEDSMLAEAFEAVLGAVYEDAGGDGNGLEMVRQIWEGNFPYEEDADDDRS